MTVFKYMNLATSIMLFILATLILTGLYAPNKFAGVVFLFYAIDTLHCFVVDPTKFYKEGSV